MRYFAILGLILIVAGLILVIASFFKPLIMGAKQGGEVSGCIILFFIPICFSSKSSLIWLPLAFSILALAAVIIMFIIMLRLLSLTTSRVFRT